MADIRINSEPPKQATLEDLGYVQVVRCKDCKHRPKTIKYGKTLEDYVFPDGSKCPCRCSPDEYYSWNPDDDWFCADGERRKE